MFATTASCGTIVAIVALILDSERFLEFLLMSTLQQLIMASAPAPPPKKKEQSFPVVWSKGSKGIVLIAVLPLVAPGLDASCSILLLASLSENV